MNKQFLGIISLVFTAMIWGLGFTAQRVGMDYLGPFAFNAIRSFLGGLSLLPVIFFVTLIDEDKKFSLKAKQLRSILLLKGGFLCGLVLFCAMSIQQYCMQFVQAGKAGFISSLYIIFVPLISFLLGEKLSMKTLISVFVALIGVYLLCFSGDLSTFNIFDFVLLISAFFFGLHIIIVNIYSQRMNSAS